MTLTEYLTHFIGRPYIWCGNGSGGSAGFDCSGLVLEGLWALGIYSGPDVTSQGIYDHFTKKAKWKSIPVSKAKDGDLLFFGQSTKKITHVAVALGNGLMLEAGGGGSKCTSTNTSTGFVRVRPVANRKDSVACLSA